MYVVSNKLLSTIQSNQLQKVKDDIFIFKEKNISLSVNAKN